MNELLLKKEEKKVFENIKFCPNSSWSHYILVKSDTILKKALQYFKAIHYIIYIIASLEWRLDRMFLLPIKVTESDHVTRTF